MHMPKNDSKTCVSSWIHIIWFNFVHFSFHTCNWQSLFVLSFFLIHICAISCFWWLWTNHCCFVVHVSWYFCYFVPNLKAIFVIHCHFNESIEIYPFSFWQFVFGRRSSFYMFGSFFSWITKGGEEGGGVLMCTHDFNHLCASFWAKMPIFVSSLSCICLFTKLFPIQVHCLILQGQRLNWNW